MRESPGLEGKESNSNHTTSESFSKERTSSLKSEFGGKTKIFKVREDVYLVQNNNLVDKNLLRNSISNKLRQGIPGELCNRTEVVNKLRRENLKEYLRLSSLNKKFSSEMQMEKNRISSEGHQLIKRQEQMRRNSDTVRRNQEKMKVFFDNRKNSSSTLPQISHRATTPVARRIVDHTNGESTYVKRLDRPSTYPRVPIDKDDSTYVKVYKQNGIFLPQNKYPDKHSIAKPEGSILKKGQTPMTPDYEDLTLCMNELDTYSNPSSSPVATPKEISKQKSARRVTWSGVDREKPETAPKSAAFVRKTPEMFSPVQDGRSELNSTPCSQKSFKSDSALYKQISYRKGRSKIETIGIQWKLPPGAKVDNSRSRSAGHLSKNLNPCSTNLEKEGMSITRTKWHVPRIQSLESYDLYKVWLEKLEKLKTGENNRMPIGPRIHSSNRSISLTVPTMSEIPNPSLITGSNM